MAVRMKDIAHDLGISVMAVSKALRDHKDIGDETKARVLKRAAELGYRVNWVARSMVTGRTYLVGLVVPDLKQSFFAEIATALSATLAPAGYHVLIANTDESASDESQDIDLLVARKVDGLVIASAQHSAGSLKKLATPYVLIDRAIPGLEANFVGSCDEEIGYVATAHLLEQGCRRVAHLAGPSSSASKGRLAGYRKALAEHGGGGALPEICLEAGHDDAGGYRAMQALLAREDRPDGVFCFNDPVGTGAMRAIFDAGLRVPDDVALIGAANMRYSDMLRVPLSTVDQGTAAIGDKAGQLLLDLMTSASPAPPRRVNMPVRLIARASSQRRS